MRRAMSLMYHLLPALMVTVAAAKNADESLLERSRWRFYADPNEMSSLYINDLVQEIGGYVWLATDRELVTLDGSEFVVEKVPDVPKDIRYNCLLYSADGTVWIGTSEGVVRYIAHEWDYPIRGGNVTALAEGADGTVWVGISPSPEDQARAVASGNAGIHSCRHGQWSYHTPGRNAVPVAPIRMLYGDREGGVWAILGSGQTTTGVYRYFNGAWSDIAHWMRPPAGDILTMTQSRDGAYWFGTYGQGVWRWHDGTWETFSDASDVRTFTARSLLPMPDGSVWAVGSPAGIVFNCRDGAWTSYPIRDIGIAGRMVTKMVYVLDDAFWFLLPGYGVARFDRRGGPWWVLDERHGLPPTGSVSVIGQGVNRTVWVGTSAGLLRYEDGRFVAPPTLPDVSDRDIGALLTWPDGRIWITGVSPFSRHGIWQLDGDRWSRVSTLPILDERAVIRTILRAKNGDIWVGTTDHDRTDGFGLFRLRDGEWHIFTKQDVLPANRILSITEDTSGTIWVGTPDGVARYDGEAWRSFTQGDGLQCTFAWTVCAARNGAVWVGGNQPNAGLSRYLDGEWTHFTTDSGLASDDVWSVIEDEDGDIWVGTARGVSRFDGRQWFSVRAGNGLAKDQVWAASLLGDGSLWFGHFDGEITKYHATSTDPPQVFIEEVPEGVAHPGFLAILWRGKDRWERTPTSDLYFAWRLDGGEWSPFAKERSHLFRTLPYGPHTFQVIALDDESNSNPIGETVSFHVEPPFWLTGWFLVPSIVGTLGIVMFAGIAYQRNRAWRRAQAQVMGELQRELQVAQRLQAELLPQSDPTVPGLEITGLCRPARQVGGDYFTYLWTGNGASQIGVAIADVTGHAMQAAIPAVLFSGMLATATRQTARPAEVLTVLNEALRTRTGKHTFICCTIGVFDLHNNLLRLANAGGLDPVHRKTDSSVDTLEVEGDRLPLGMISDISYQERTIPLSPGDIFVFLTDGLVEARSPTGEMFGFERLLSGISGRSSVGEVRDGLLTEGTAHMATREQDDDITLLVVRVSSQR